MNLKKKKKNCMSRKNENDFKLGRRKITNKNKNKKKIM